MEVQFSMNHIMFGMRVQLGKDTRINEKEGLVCADKVNAWFGTIILYVGRFFDKFIQVLVYQKIAKDIPFPVFIISFPEKRWPGVKISWEDNSWRFLFSYWVENTSRDFV